jgi:hypothetical protein
MPSTKSLAARQKACLLVALASLNNGHSSNLCACYVGVRSSSKPNLVHPKPLHPHSTAWWSSFITNLSSTVPGRVLSAEVEAHTITSPYCMVAMTLAHSFIQPYNSSMLNRCISSFSVFPSLASKFVRHKLSLHSSYLGASTRVSTAQLTT